MKYPEAVALIRGGTRFLVMCHRRPDADALGSALGLASILRAAGKVADVLVPDEVPTSLLFLPGVDGIRSRLEEGERFDATFVMDTAASALLPPGFPGPDVRGTTVVVDHHVAHDGFGDLKVRDTSACATAEVVLDLMSELGVTEVPAPAAMPLYSAIVADTGGFRYASTRPDTLRIAARLLERGADPWIAAYHLFEAWPRQQLELLRAVIETLVTTADGRIATLRVTRAMLDGIGATDEMVEGLVNYGRMLRGVEIAALLWEQAEERGTPGPVTKVSLRSRGEADVAAIALALGGGGHRTAAGTLLPMPIDEAEARVRHEAEKQLPR